MGIQSKFEWLSWRGYSERKPISLNGWTEGFAFPSSFFEKVPYCVESYAMLRNVDVDDRMAMQADLFERTNHSVMGCLFLGLMQPGEAAWLKEQLKLALHAMVRLLQLIAIDDIHSDELNKLFTALSPKSADLLRSVLRSSLYFYANGQMKKPFSKVFQQPLYIETGIDILSRGRDLMLAEFQVRYATPYPHLLQNMSQTYAHLLPELFEKFGLQQETFSARRKILLDKCIAKFQQLGDEAPAKLLIDAWAYTENAGANLRATADEIGMDYILFDDLSKVQNVYERAYRNKRLAIFNFAPLNLLDPANALFDRVNAEKLEDYDELAWEGLLDRYCNGEIFLANSPMSDLLNDKALYGLIPELCQVFFGKTLELAIGDVRPCWSETENSKPNEEVLSWAKANKDKAVIAHRYLEGGLGIRVGPSTSSDEWESFIDTFVVDRPYLYVVRDYFAMEPDFCLRSLAALSLDELSADISQAETEFSDTFYARLSTQSPITTDNHRAFLIFPTAADASKPSYQFERESVR